jgi:hypothetical protein
VVPEGNRERFEASFFHQLTQQRLGPGVLGSVRSWILRVEALETSDEPGAREVLATLRKRGLSTALLTEMKSLVESLTVFTPSTGHPASGPAQHALAEARAERHRALQALRAWHHDWATTLRSAYDRRQLLQLGLVSRKTRSKPVHPTPQPKP